MKTWGVDEALLFEHSYESHEAIGKLGGIPMMANVLILTRPASNNRKQSASRVKRRRRSASKG
jgi:hypothetical protein